MCRRFAHGCVTALLDGIFDFFFIVRVWRGLEGARDGWMRSIDHNRSPWKPAFENRCDLECRADFNRHVFWISRNVISNFSSTQNCKVQREKNQISVKRKKKCNQKAEEVLRFCTCKIGIPSVVSMGRGNVAQALIERITGRISQGFAFSFGFAVNRFSWMKGELW